MVLYDHECQNKECNYCWEEEYSIKDDPPKNCPKCNQETAKRVISCLSKGIVELYGDELASKIMGEANSVKKEAYKNENLYANLMGESKYHEMQTRLDRCKK